MVGACMTRAWTTELLTSPAGWGRSQRQAWAEFLVWSACGPVPVTGGM